MFMRVSWPSTNESTMSKYFTQSKAIDFIERAFGSGRLSNQGLNISVICPMCKALKGEDYSKKKLVIRTDNFLVHCWVCGYKSKNIYHLLRKYRPKYLQEYRENFFSAKDLSNTDAEDDQKEGPTVSMPKGSQFILHMDKDGYWKEAMSYLNYRGIRREDDIWYWKICLTRNSEQGCNSRVIIPSFDHNGDLNYWTARTWKGNVKQKYKNPPVNRKNLIFNENNIDWTKEITLVEGPFDLIKCNANATAVLGSELDANYRLFHRIVENETPVLLAFDPDAKGKQNRIALLLKEFNIQVRVVSPVDLNKDIGSLSRSEFNELRNRATLFDEDSLLFEKIKSIL